MEQKDKRYAVLIDADNIGYKYVPLILQEISSYGVATYKRSYGDWSSENMKNWKKVLLNNSVTPVQQYSYTTGKNSTDFAMVIDAMDILYSQHVDGFCIASSDSDFTRLATRLREAGMDVIGMGETKTPKPFISACNAFKYLDKLAEAEAEEGSEDTSVELDDEAEAIEDVRKSNVLRLNKLKKVLKTLVEENSDGDGWMHIGDLGNRLQKRFPDFDPRNYGFKKFSLFIESLDDLFTIKKENQAVGSGVIIYAKLKYNNSGKGRKRSSK